MEYIKIKGIVCKITEYKESDKILTILTFEKGKMQVVAKGVKKKGAALAHAARLFYCGQFECVCQNNIPILTGATMIQDYFGLTNKMESLYYASHFMDICSYFIQEEQPSYDIMSLLLNSLYLLMRNEGDPMLLTAIIQFRLSSIEGAAPITDFCVECQKPLDNNCSLCFSLDNDGITCCNNGICISCAVFNAIAHICNAEASKIFFFNIPKKDLPVIYDLSCKYIEKIAGKHFEILDRIKEL
ncbi:MAG: DNA repair protein RecO [Clostridia bacterium]|jgi:DNA repair protein RecO (recombination protein O)